MTEAVANPTQWLNTLLDEIKSFDGNLFPPTDPMPEGETVIAICPEELRPFYSYMRYCQREMKQAQLEQEFVADQNEKANLQAKFFDMRARAGVCSLVMWSCVNQKFGQWALVGHFNMRAEWKLTHHECDRGGPGELFRRIFSGE